MGKIEYLDMTWNPVAGCRKISPGCWAEKMANRLACQALKTSGGGPLKEDAKKKYVGVIGPFGISG